MDALRQLVRQYPDITAHYRRRLPKQFRSHSKDCDPCHVGKQTRQPFRVSDDDYTDQPLQLIQTDTTGPIQPPGVEGHRYVQLVLDRGSGKVAAPLLRLKSEAAREVLRVIKRWQLQQNQSVKRYHADNAKELHQRSIVDALRDQGTIVSTTTPHSSQQNGALERRFRYFINAVRSALHAAHLPQHYWTYALKDAVDKYNAMPQVNGKPSPAKIFDNSQAPPDYFLPFGQTGWVTVTSHKAKLAPRATQMRYLCWTRKYIICHALARSRCTMGNQTLSLTRWHHLRYYHLLDKEMRDVNM
jgi:transposase InsO family protein